MLKLEEYGFKSVQGIEASIPECCYLSKRQTFNTNRAVCVLKLSEMPENLHEYLHSIRKRIAFKIGFFPVFWGLGLQVVILCPKATSVCTPPVEYVAKSDNQWAIVQSIFLIDPEKLQFIEARSWGQLVTGRFQDAISQQLRTLYEDVSI